MFGEHQEVQDNFDQVVPNAAAHSEMFLRVVRDRCNEAGMGLTLTPVRADRKTDRVVMRGDVKFGNALKTVRRYTLEVYADPRGAVLQVGWQLNSHEMDGPSLGQRALFGSMAAGADRWNRKQTRLHNDPNTQRELNGVVQGFHQMVFLPTLQDLMSAVGQGAGGRGFLHA